MSSTVQEICLSLQSAFCTYKLDFLSSFSDMHVRQNRYYCCQHVFFLIWPCTVNFNQQAPFLFHSSASVLSKPLCPLRLKFKLCQTHGAVVSLQHTNKLCLINDTRCSPFPKLTWLIFDQQTCVMTWSKQLTCPPRRIFLLLLNFIENSELLKWKSACAGLICILSSKNIRDIHLSPMFLPGLIL